MADTKTMADPPASVDESQTTPRVMQSSIPMLPSQRLYNNARPDVECGMQKHTKFQLKKRARFQNIRILCLKKCEVAQTQPNPTQTQTFATTFKKPYTQETVS